jgi:hypothetical protein
MGICAFGNWDLVKILAGKWEPSAELTHTRARAKYIICHYRNPFRTLLTNK